MEELRKIADTCIEMLETEADCPSNHPELEHKVPILDLSVWVEKVHLPAPWLERQDGDIHRDCNKEEVCLPIGAPSTEGLEEGPRPATRLVSQIFFQFYRKPMAPNQVILAESAQPWQQKRTTATQELIRRLLNTRKELTCCKKQKIITEYTQLLKNSDYDAIFRSDILKSGLKGYNKILEAHDTGTKPLYRSKEWRRSSQGMEDRKKRKSKNWLGNFKSCIFVPPTPGSVLQKLMQAKEIELRAGGRETLPIKIIETAGKPLERVLVTTDPFKGNICTDKTCIPNRNVKNRIGCRRNNVGYEIRCKICPWAGGSGPEPEQDPACYFGETGQNMHTRMKVHESKFRSKLKKSTRNISILYSYEE